MARELDEVANVYRAPEADAESEHELHAQGQRRRASFYTVSIATLLALHVVTLGLYSVYWFYQHWSVQKRVHGLRISPLGRAVFSIFFAHRLFRTIDEGARSAGLAPAWDPASQASIYVVMALFSSVGGQMGPDGLTGTILVLAVGLLRVFPLLTAQKIANAANERLLQTANDETDDDDDDDDDD